MRPHLSVLQVCVGGGAGGVAIAAKFAKTLGEGAVAVIEPSDVRRNQILSDCFQKIICKSACNQVFTIAFKRAFVNFASKKISKAFTNVNAL